MEDVTGIKAYEVSFPHIGFALCPASPPPPTTAPRLAWLDRLARDPAVPDLAFRVAHLISRAIDKARVAGIGRETIAAHLERNVRTVDNAIAKLTPKYTQIATRLVFCCLTGVRFGWIGENCGRFR